MGLSKLTDQVEEDPTLFLVIPQSDLPYYRAWRSQPWRKFSLNSSSEPSALLGIEEVTKIKLFECIFTFTREAGSPYKFTSFSRSVMSDSLWPHGQKHARPPCPSPTPWVYSNSCPLSRWYHPIISSSAIPFASHLQSFPSSGSFQMSQLFASGGQIIGASAAASVLPMNIQDWSPLGWTGWVSLQSKGPSRVFSSTTVQKHQFSGAQLSL